MLTTSRMRSTTSSNGLRPSPAGPRPPRMVMSFKVCIEQRLSKSRSDCAPWAINDFCVARPADGEPFPLRRHRPLACHGGRRLPAVWHRRFPGTREKLRPGRPVASFPAELRGWGLARNLCYPPPSTSPAARPFANRVDGGKSVTAFRRARCPRARPLQARPFPEEVDQARSPCSRRAGRGRRGARRRALPLQMPAAATGRRGKPPRRPHRARGPAGPDGARHHLRGASPLR